MAAVLIAALYAPVAAFADSSKYDVSQKLFVDKKPAAHQSATLVDCKTGDVIAGPIDTDDSGSVTWPNVEDGKDCVRVERMASSGSAPDEIDHSLKTASVDVVLSPLLPTWTENALPFALCIGCVLLVIGPILQFLIRPWTARREKLMGLLAGEPMRLYYQKFRANVVIVDGKMPSSYVAGNEPGYRELSFAFKRDFGIWYGRRYYIFPVTLLTLVTGCCAYWGAIEARGWIDGVHTVDSMAGLSAAALAGGLMWVLSDEIDRLMRHDFTTSDVYYYVFRLLISIPFAWAITRLQLTLQIGIPTAFLLGAFPTSTLFTIARRLGSQKLGLGDDPDTGKLELENLISVGKTNAERFKEADISNISQLTRADPVDLAISTNFDFHYISDCVNEALLWVYVGDKLASLAVYSVRGACEAWQLLQDYNSADVLAVARAKQTIADIIAAFAVARNNPVTLTEASLVETLHQAGDDPFTTFLMATWPSEA